MTRPVLNKQVCCLQTLSSPPCYPSEGYYSSCGFLFPSTKVTNPSPQLGNQTRNWIRLGRRRRRSQGWPGDIQRFRKLQAGRQRWMGQPASNPPNLQDGPVDGQFDKHIWSRTRVQSSVSTFLNIHFTAICRCHWHVTNTPWPPGAVLQRGTYSIWLQASKPQQMPEFRQAVGSRLQLLQEKSVSRSRKDFFSTTFVFLLANSFAIWYADST